MTANKDPKIGGILLAAGGSSRLGQPKQLLNFKGKTLIRRAAETLLESTCKPIVVVLGSEIDRSTAELDGLDVAICFNENWQTGMSSSIAAGLKELLEIEPYLAAVVITLCDQPFVDANMIDRLIAEFVRIDTTIVAAEYAGTRGVPAIFSADIFEELFRLAGNKGARDLIRNHVDTVGLRLDQGSLDIDTPDDIQMLTRSL